jgi:hypothetical protein
MLAMPDASFNPQYIIAVMKSRFGWSGRPAYTALPR